MNEPMVLIVDDKPANLVALEAVLEPLRGPVIRAASGEDALRALLKHGEDIAVMLLDVQMPGLDGFETARLIRKRESLKHLPIIFVTAVSREEAHIVKGYAQDAVDYIVKPFNPDIMRSKVKVFVDLHRRASERERMRVEEEQRTVLVLEAAELGSWSWERSTKRVVCDARCRALLGVSRDEEVPLSTLGFNDVVPTKGDERVRFEIHRADGRWLLSHGRAYWDGSGVSRILGVLADISDDKQLLEERELFLGALGHDLRGPLQAVGMAAHLLQQHEDPRVNEPARRLATAGTRMMALINDLLEFVRSRVGDLPIDRQPADLTAICRDVIAELELAHPTRQIELQASGSAEGHWDRGRLSQVVQNLISNALHHGDASRPVRVRVSATDAVASLDVENSGLPIPRELQTRIFDPFVRSGARGLGLGLYIVRQLVKAHLGTVEVTSDSSSTCFRVTLPKGAPVEDGTGAPG